MDEWTKIGPNILDDATLSRVKDALSRGSIAVDHMYYRGGCSLTTHLFDDYDDFIEYVNTMAKPGDQFVIFDLEDLWLKKLYAVKAKFPNAKGEVPVGGAY